MQAAAALARRSRRHACLRGKSTANEFFRSGLFFTSSLPDGDVPDVSKGGLPFSGMIVPYLSKLHKVVESAEMPLGRWKVSSCDEAMSSRKSASYDHDAGQQLSAPTAFVNSDLPDGEVSDMSKGGVPNLGVLGSLLSSVTKTSAEDDPLPLGRWQLKGSANNVFDKDISAGVYDHCMNVTTKVGSSPTYHVNTSLPDGDIPSVSEGGLPIQGLVLPFLNRVSLADKDEKQPLGRWAVRSSEEVFDSASSSYDHGSSSSELTSPAKFYNSKLPDGEVPDVAKEGFPIAGLVSPFLSKVASGSVDKSEKLPLGRWGVPPSDVKPSSTTYDHSA